MNQPCAVQTFAGSGEGHTVQFCREMKSVFRVTKGVFEGLGNVACLTCMKFGVLSPALHRSGYGGEHL